MTTNAKTIPLGMAIIMRGWSYQEFAKLIGKTRDAIGDIVAGRRYPQRGTRQDICRALGITNDQLCDMLEASAALALLEGRQRFCRSVADMARLAKRIERPEPVVVAVARAGRSSLTKLIRRRKRKITIVIPCRRRRQPADGSLRGAAQGVGLTPV